MNTSRHKPTMQEVDTALQKGGGVSRRPQSASDVARNITVANGGTYQEPSVNRAELDRLLAEMVKNGSVECRTGQEWRGLSPSAHGLTPRGRYYALNEWVRRWEAAADERRAEERLIKARKQARNALVGRHPDEYQELVKTFLAENTSPQTP